MFANVSASGEGLYSSYSSCRLSGAFPCMIIYYNVAGDSLGITSVSSLSSPCCCLLFHLPPLTPILLSKTLLFSLPSFSTPSSPYCTPSLVFFTPLTPLAIRPLRLPFCTSSISHHLFLLSITTYYSHHNHHHHIPPSFPSSSPPS